MDGKRDGVGVRVYVQGGELAKRSFDQIADSGKKMFAEIAVGAKTANPAIVALNDASEKAGDGMDGVGKAGAAGALGLGLMTTAGVAVGVALAGVAIALQKTREAMAMGDEIADTAAKLQIGTTALQEWRFMAQKAGVAVGDMDAAFGKFAEKFGEAKLGEGEGVKWFDALGLDREALDDLDTVDAALTEVLKRIGEVGDAAERAAIADKLGLSDLLPMANAGEEALARFRREAEELGYVIDEDVIKRLSDANDQSEILANVIDAHLAVAFADLAPILIQTLELIADITGQIGDMIDKVKDFRRETQQNWMRQPEWVRNTALWSIRKNDATKAAAWAQGINPDTGLPTDDYWTSMASPDRSFTVPGRRTVELPDRPERPTRRSRGAPRDTGPTAEEKAAMMDRIALEQQLAIARAGGDEATTRALESERYLASQRDKYLRAGQSAPEADRLARQDAAMLDEAKARKESWEALRTYIENNTVEVDADPKLIDFGLSDKVVGPDGNLWTEEQKQAWSRSVGEATAEGLDVALQGGDVWEWLKNRFYQSALEGVATGIEQAMMNSEIGSWMNGGSGGNGSGWAGIVSGVIGLFGGGSGGNLSGGQTSAYAGFAGRATGGAMDPGNAYRLGEHGQPELFMAGNGYVANADATRRMLVEAVAQAQGASGARGGGGPRRTEIALTAKLEVPAGYVPDASMARMMMQFEDRIVGTLGERIGELSRDQNAEYFILKE